MKNSSSAADWNLSALYGTIVFVLSQQCPLRSHGFQFTSPARSSFDPHNVLLQSTRPHSTLKRTYFRIDCTEHDSPLVRLHMVDTSTEEKTGQDSEERQDEARGVFSEAVQQEAKEALESVGWASPTPLDDNEMTSDDPFVQEINAGIQRDFGVGLDDLLNPAKVVNLERELYNLRLELASLTDKKNSEDGNEFIMSSSLSTEECDGGGGGEDAAALRMKISKKETDLSIERRSVFRDWLKNVFVGQAVISLGLSFVMATNPKVLFGGFDWYYSYNMDISIQVLGYWFWWLFIVPSLRSRRPKGPEKSALDIAFLGTPLISILAPIATKDTGLIWLANLAVVAGAYGYAFVIDGDDDDDEQKDDSQQPAWLKFVYKSLDFGSGRERGARK